VPHSGAGCPAARRSFPHDSTVRPFPIEVPEADLADLRDRLTMAGLSDERIEQHMTAGRVRVDGELITDLDTPAPAGTRVVVWAE
jgi:hypothetical protein